MYANEMWYERETRVLHLRNIYLTVVIKFELIRRPST